MDDLLSQMREANGFIYKPSAEHGPSSAFSEDSFEGFVGIALSFHLFNNAKINTESPLSSPRAAHQPAQETEETVSHLTRESSIMQADKNKGKN